MGLGTLFFFLFKPYKNLIHWRTELDTILLGIILISITIILLFNLFSRYKREKELALQTKIFWGAFFINLFFLLIMCYRNSGYLRQEGGAGAWAY